MLVVDVVETGETLRKHLEALNGAGIEVHKTVLAAISKGGSNQTQVGTYNVSSFLSTSGIAPTDICPQCELGLPFTSDAAEGITRIRAYDMWYMANEVWWQHEPDVPDNVGEAYEFIPDYPVMLSKFGDWIAYKMEILLRAINHPQNMFVIHPDESGAISVSSRLRLRFDNQLIVVKVPRDAIKAAQSVGNAWDQILPHYSGDEWLALLNSLSQATALITDVFNGSGSTFFSIFSLLEQLDIKVFCYFPFVDRDCDPANSKKYPIQKYSLYEWYGPRQLNREGGTS
jgi:adenine/guanine phosphoribosyltransferase-like PRPP-binding protein